MPLYEYQCIECEEVFYELRTADEREEPTACPECGGAGHVIISQVAPATGTDGTGAGGCSGDT